MIDLPSSLDNEKDVLIAIRERVACLIEQNPDLLFSYLYRLDIQENKIQAALKNQNNSDVIDQIAELIWSRQKERITTKNKIPVKPIDGYDW